mgnify:CR=1 FL=1
MTCNLINLIQEKSTLNYEVVKSIAKTVWKKTMLMGCVETKRLLMLQVLNKEADRTLAFTPWFVDLYSVESRHIEI